MFDVAITIKSSFARFCFCRRETWIRPPYYWPKSPPPSSSFVVVRHSFETLFVRNSRSVGRWWRETTICKKRERHTMQYIPTVCSGRPRHFLITGSAVCLVAYVLHAPEVVSSCRSQLVSSSSTLGVCAKDRPLCHSSWTATGDRNGSQRRPLWPSLPIAMPVLVFQGAAFWRFLGGARFGGFLAALVGPPKMRQTRASRLGRTKPR
jgi:hypothetical protein